MEIITLTKNLYDLVFKNPIKFDLLEDELLKYQSMSEKDILNDIWKSTVVYEKNAVIYHRMNIIWAYFRKPMPLLGKIVLPVLTIPNSNVTEERTFLMINKYLIFFFYKNNVRCTH